MWGKARESLVLLLGFPRIRFLHWGLIISSWADTQNIVKQKHVPLGEVIADSTEKP